MTRHRGTRPACHAGRARLPRGPRGAPSRLHRPHCERSLFVGPGSALGAVPGLAEPGRGGPHRRLCERPLHVPGRARRLSPSITGPRTEPVVVLARPDRYHPFRRVTTVVARGEGIQLSWQLRVRPRTRTIFIARANSEPSEGE